MGEVLLDLAARCEAATGSDRKLDAEICRLIDLPQCEYPDCLPELFLRLIDRVAAGGEDPDIPHYTSSIDTALTLVPGGWRVQLFQKRGGGWFARVVRDIDYLVIAPFETDKPDTETAANPALAIASPALRARSLELSGQREAGGDT